MNKLIGFIEKGKLSLRKRTFHLRAIRDGSTVYVHIPFGYFILIVFEQTMGL